MRFFSYMCEHAVHMREHATAVIAILGSSYHPERHYMRGPGPACAARAARMVVPDGRPAGQHMLH